MKKHKKAFTLVELIVVITILAILGTIAFISLQGYSKSARDSVRISDLNLIRKSLDLYHVKTGYYPNTTSGFQVTYSGAEIRTQGTFGATTFSNIEKLNKIPVDPLTGSEYTYSLLNTKKEYELGTIYETDNFLSQKNLIIDKTYAVGEIVTAGIIGNYNGLAAKVSTGSTTYVLAVPSIINSQIGDVDIYDIMMNDEMVYNGYKNLPSSYNNTQYNVNPDGIINLVNTGSFVVFSGSIDDLKEEPNQNIFINNLKAAYLNTDIVNTPEIEKIINITDLNKIYLAQIIVKNILIPSIEITAKNDFGPQSYKNIDGSFTYYLPDSASGSLRFLSSTDKTIVTDLLTGLVWQSHKTTTGNGPDFNTNTTWAVSKTYCDDLVLGGFTDWRMPDVTELGSIVDRSRINPTLDLNYFSLSSNFDYWSSTFRTSSVWQVSFDTGFSRLDNALNSRPVRCVRYGSLKLPWQGTNISSFDINLHTGNTYEPESRFESQSDKQVVYDNITFLHWQSHKTNTGYGPYWNTVKTWNDAKTFCNDLDLGGHTDWRLPTTIELSSITDYSRYNPSIVLNYFSASPGRTWTSNIDLNDNSKAINISFMDGTIYNASNKSSQINLRCVY